MKPLTLIFLLLPCIAWSQADSLRLEGDTVRQNAEAKLDSLEQGFTKTSDSIRNAYTSKVQRLAQLGERYSLRIDSIKNKRPETPGNPLDTIGTTADVNRYTKKLDSLDQQLASIQQTTTDKLDSVKAKVTQQISKLKLPKAAEGKVAGLNSMMDKVNVPAFNTDIAKQSGLNISTSLPGFSTKLPRMELPQTSTPNIPDVTMPDATSSLPQTGINTGELNDITGQAGSVQQQVKEATASEEALGKTLEGKAAEQVKGLPDKNLPDTPGLPGALPKTGDEAKEQVMNLAKKEAVNHFAGKEQVLTSAMEKMSKYKRKYNSVNSLKDIKDDKPHNEMRGKPLRERLVPALTLQFQSWQDLMLDINPSIGYKLNSHMVVGIGWNQRIAFNVPARDFNRYANVHGFRSYGEYNLKKGFGIRADIECMNTPLKERIITDAPPQRAWVWSAMVGIKQKYPIYKKLKGNAQLMYNLFDKDHRSPYTDRINWRIGLELTLKKKKAEQK